MSHPDDLESNEEQLPWETVLEFRKRQAEAKQRLSKIFDRPKASPEENQAARIRIAKMQYDGLIHDRSALERGYREGSRRLQKASVEWHNSKRSLNLYLVDMAGYDLDHIKEALKLSDTEIRKMVEKAGEEGMSTEDMAIHLISAVDVQSGRCD